MCRTDLFGGLLRKLFSLHQVALAVSKVACLRGDAVLYIALDSILLEL